MKRKAIENVGGLMPWPRKVARQARSRASQDKLMNTEAACPALPHLMLHARPARNEVNFGHLDSQSKVQDPPQVCKVNHTLINTNHLMAMSGMHIKGTSSSAQQASNDVTQWGTRTP
eukprot:1160773-Pelagomonas_calceolata.AAC.6